MEFEAIKKDNFISSLETCLTHSNPGFEDFKTINITLDSNLRLQILKQWKFTKNFEVSTKYFGI